MVCFLLLLSLRSNDDNDNDNDDDDNDGDDDNDDGNDDDNDDNDDDKDDYKDDDDDEIYISHCPPVYTGGDRSPGAVSMRYWIHSPRVNSRPRSHPHSNSRKAIHPASNCSGHWNAGSMAPPKTGNLQTPRRFPSGPTAQPNTSPPKRCTSLPNRMGYYILLYIHTYTHIYIYICIYIYIYTCACVCM